MDVWVASWFGAAFVVSLIGAMAAGVRGAICSFLFGGLLPLAPVLIRLVRLLQRDGTPDEINIALGGLDSAAFAAAYWWMMAYPAAAIGLYLRSRRRRRDPAHNVF